MQLPHSIQQLIDEFAKLPGVGPKTAARLTFYLLSKPQEEVRTLGNAVVNLTQNLKTCSVCGNYAETDPCGIDQDPQRSKTKIMVVEEPLDVIALERTGYDGVYHVLGGVLSPIHHIGPEELRIASLNDRLTKNSSEVEEVILATDPSLEGEATALYLLDRLKPLGIKITRIARGLPVGGDLEYTDEITLSRALEGRREY